MDIIEGREYEVTIPPLRMVGGNSGCLMDSAGLAWGPCGDLARLGAVITEVIPPEPAVGSVWRDSTGYDWRRYGWPIAEQWVCSVLDTADHWPEVVARGGSLIHDAGAQS